MFDLLRLAGRAAGPLFTVALRGRPLVVIPPEGNGATFLGGLFGAM